MIEVLFLVALVLIWVSILYGLVLTAAAMVSMLRRTVEGRRPAVPGTRVLRSQPGVTVLVPARNEAEVIASSLDRYLGLDYPDGRLQVVVVDDGSTDGTAAILDCYAASDPRLTVVHVPLVESGRGKAAALNRALPVCRHPLIAVYDADDTPLPDALRHLVAALGGRYVAAVGRIVKTNRRATLLNRFAWLDFATFQWTFQAGRAALFDTVLLPGTNYVITAETVRSLGGWDPRALTEDLELSARIHCSGGRIAFVPEAVSEEQDPERVRVWLRQRTRWLVGGGYVLARRSGAMLRSRRLSALVLLAELTQIYVLFVFALIASQAILLAGLAGLHELEVGGPLLVVWGLALALFLLPLLNASAWEREDGWTIPLLGLGMYVLYAPLWLLVLGRACVVSVRGKGAVPWAKTPHFRL